MQIKISVLDGSNYFKGLLLLIRKDKKVTQPEIDLMTRVGKTLGFAGEFCEHAIQEILENRYIEDTPPLFSSRELAIKFVKDGFSLASSDNEVHATEEQWLRSTAECNGLDRAWFTRQRARVERRKSPMGRLEVEDLTVDY